MGFAALYADENLRNKYFSIFCENHSTSNCSKTHHFGPNFMNEGFLEFKSQGEYFVIFTNNDLTIFSIFNSLINSKDLWNFDVFSHFQLFGPQKLKKDEGHKKIIS